MVHSTFSTTFVPLQKLQVVVLFETPLATGCILIVGVGCWKRSSPSFDKVDSGR